MNDFDGGSASPFVGEVYALRTYKIADDGALLPVASAPIPWEAGVNEATCTRNENHLAPEEECTCGFYAYSSPAWVEYQQQTHILATVACSGRATVGTQGIRAQRAQIVAIWMSRLVPADLRAQVASRYPDAQVYSKRSAMLSQWPPTRMEYTSKVNLSVRRVATVALRTMIAACYALLAYAILAWSLDLPFPVAPWVSPLAPFLLLMGFFLVLRVFRASVRRTDPLLRLCTALVFVAFPACFSLTSEWNTTKPVGTVAFAFVLGSGVWLWGLWLWPVPRLRHLRSLADTGPWTVAPGYPQWVDGCLVHLLGCGSKQVLLIQPLNVDQNISRAGPTEGHALWRNASGGKYRADAQIWCGGGAAVTVRKGRHTSILTTKEVWALFGLPGGLWFPPALRVSAEEMLKAGQSERPVMVPFAWPYRPLMFSDPDCQAALDDALVLAERRWYRTTQAAIAKTEVEPAAMPVIVGGRRGDLGQVVSGWGKLLDLEVASDAVATMFTRVESDLRGLVEVRSSQRDTRDGMDKVIRQLHREGYVESPRRAAHDVMVLRLVLPPVLHVRQVTGNLDLDYEHFAHPDGRIVVICKAVSTPCTGDGRSMGILSTGFLIIIEGEVVGVSEAP